jgi:CBS domain-containing protein
VVGDDEWLGTVFKRLTCESFMGCPVVDSNGVYINQVDMLDIVFFVCRLFKSRQNKPNTPSHREIALLLQVSHICYFFADYDDDLDVYYVSSSPTKKTKWSDFFQLEQFKTTRVHQLLKEAAPKWSNSRITYLPSLVGCSTLGVLEQMVRLGAHRIPMLSDDGHVQGLVTQSMFISLFSQHMDRLGCIKYVWVSDFVRSLSAFPFVVLEDSIAINAFKQMVKHNVSALGVVDKDGCLVDTISVSDLSGMGCDTEHFERLWYPIKRFKLSVQNTRKPSVVTLTDTLETIIRQMDDGNVHVVFVVDLSRAPFTVPLHVITQRDVLQAVCNQIGMGTTISSSISL